MSSIVISSHLINILKYTSFATILKIMLADEGIIGTCFKTIRLTLESLNVLRVYKEDEMIFGFSHLQELFIKIPDSVDLKSSYT